MGHERDRLLYTLGTLLELVNLLHLQMLNGPDVSHQGLFAGAGELAERAVVGKPLQWDISVQQVFFHLLHVIEENSGDLVLLVGHVDLDFMRAVGLELARVAAEIDGVDAGQESQLPLILRASLFDVVDVAKTLQVFVRFAMKLKVSLQVGAVVAKVAQVVAADDDGDLIFSGPAAVV